MQVSVKENIDSFLADLARDPSTRTARGLLESLINTVTEQVHPEIAHGVLPKIIEKLKSCKPDPGFEEYATRIINLAYAMDETFRIVLLLHQDEQDLISKGLIKGRE